MGVSEVKLKSKPSAIALRDRAGGWLNSLGNDRSGQTPTTVRAAGATAEARLGTALRTYLVATMSEGSAGTRKPETKVIEVGRRSCQRSGKPNDGRRTSSRAVALT